MIALFDTWVQHVGNWGYALFGLAAGLEYVFPPVPGDTVTILGGAYVARGERSWALLLLALMLGSIVGIVAQWRFGQAIGMRLDAQSESATIFGFPIASVRRIQEAILGNGTWLLIVNRFVPSMRAVLIVAAGASRMPLRRVLILGTISAAFWNGLLVAVGVRIGSSAEGIATFLSLYWQVALLFVAVLAALFAVNFWRRQRASPSQKE